MLMLNLRSELRTALAEAIRRAQEAGALPKGEIGDLVVEHPPAAGGEALGDYASPVAIELGRRWKREPMAVAEAIAAHLQPPEFVGKIDGAEPGFLNVHVAPAWLAAKIDDIVEEGSALGRSAAGQGVSVNLEFVSANPTGLPHVGNGRALFAADVLGNVLAHAGYAVTREYYLNDVGTQVERYGESVLRRILMAEGHAVEYPAELYQGSDVLAIAANVREQMVEDRGHAFSPADLDDTAVRAEATRRAVDTTVAEIRRLLETVAHVRYDVWFRESTLHDRGDVREVLAELAKRGHALEKDGAVWLTSTAFGDDKDRVLVRSTGETTYLASDIAYHRDKFRRGFQLVLDFWGADHHGHIAPLRAGMAALGEDPNRLRVILAQMVRVKEGGEAKELSKRLGTAVPLSEVIDRVGLSATRFFLTMKMLSGQFDFDLDLAQAQREENPVYYAQYAYVRLASILRKAKEQNILDGSLLPPTGARVPLTEPAALRLQVLLFRLPEILEDIGASWEVHRLAQYALDLARAIHRFYETVPVLSASESDILQARVSLVVAARTVLGVVFDLLGVEKREVM